MVVDASREHLPEWGNGCFEDPRLELHYQVMISLSLSLSLQYIAIYTHYYSYTTYDALHANLVLILVAIIYYQAVYHHSIAIIYTYHMVQ
jgi:hypothetical protein